MITPSLRTYIDTQVIPLYEHLDKSHSPQHIHQVSQNSFEIAKALVVEADIVYTIAAYHDIGLLKDRANHETASRLVVEADPFLQNFFSQEQIKLIGEAVEDHRASNTQEPRSIYGKIISEADRDLDFERILTRTIQYAYEKKQIHDPEALLAEAKVYINEKYGPCHQLTFWLNAPKNLKGLANIHTHLQNPDTFDREFFRLWKHAISS